MPVREGDAVARSGPAGGNQLCFQCAPGCAFGGSDVGGAAVGACPAGFAASGPTEVSPMSSAFTTPRGDRWRANGPLTPGPGGDAGRCTGHSASWWRPRGRPHRPTRPRATKYARSAGIPVTPLWPWFAPSASAGRLPCRARAVVQDHAQLAWTWLSRRRPVCSAIAASTVAKVGTLSLHPAACSARSTHTGPSTMQIVIPRLEAR